MGRPLPKKHRFWQVELGPDDVIRYPFPTEKAARLFASNARKRGREAFVINRYGRKVS